MYSFATIPELMDLFEGKLSAIVLFGDPHSSKIAVVFTKEIWVQVSAVFSTPSQRIRVRSPATCSLMT